MLLEGPQLPQVYPVGIATASGVAARNQVQYQAKDFSPPYSQTAPQIKRMRDTPACLPALCCTHRCPLPPLLDCQADTQVHNVTQRADQLELQPACIHPGPWALKSLYAVHAVAQCLHRLSARATRRYTTVLQHACMPGQTTAMHARPDYCHACQATGHSPALCCTRPGPSLA